MNQRIDYYQISPDAVKAMMGLETHVNQGPLEKKTINAWNRLAVSFRKQS